MTKNTSSADDDVLQLVRNVAVDDRHGSSHLIYPDVEPSFAHLRYKNHSVVDFLGDLKVEAWGHQRPPPRNYHHQGQKDALEFASRNAHHLLQREIDEFQLEGNWRFDDPDEVDFVAPNQNEESRKEMNATLPHRLLAKTVIINCVVEAHDSKCKHHRKQL